MATINPNMGPISTNLAARPAVASVTAESAPSLPSDGASIDFSKNTAAAPETTRTEVPTAPAAAPEPPAVATAPAPEVQSGVAQAAAEGGLALSNTGGLAQLETPKAPDFCSSIDGCLAGLAGETKSIPTITAENINWDKGAEVVSSAQKFVIPVPQFPGGGEALVYPDGAKDKDGNDIGGKPIVDWQGQPIGEQGVVFFNPKDNAWQAVKADGQGVVIMNQMSEEQGKAIMEKVGGDPSKLTLEGFKEVLSFAVSQGCGDMYNSDRGFISKKMNALETMDSGVPQYGMFRRDDRDVCKVVFADGPSEFTALTSGGVTVKQEIPDEGAIILRQPDGKGGFLHRKIENQAFEETYRMKDGSKINLDTLPRHE